MLPNCHMLPPGMVCPSSSIGTLLKRGSPFGHGERLVFLFPENWIDPLQIHRPCYENARRVPPDELEKHSRSHYFRTPCCLCAYLKGDGSYTASKVVPLHSVNIKRHDRVRRPFVAEYVAECATNTCGYFGTPFVYFVLCSPAKIFHSPCNSGTRTFLSPEGAIGEVLCEKTCV
jgi:hypothetical protein